MEPQVLAVAESVGEFGWVLILFFRIGTCVDQTQVSLCDTGYGEMGWTSCGEVGWTGNRVDKG